jgi:hypothetical protein
MLWHGLAWTGVLVLWGLWSTLCWLARWVVGWEGWQRGGDWAAHVPEMPMPEWLSAWLGLGWVQALREALLEWGPALQAWVQSWPDLSGWASGLIWGLWALGSVLLFIAGLALSGLIALVRRSRGRTASTGG